MTTEELQRENTLLRGMVAKLVRPCHYCGLDDMSKCKRGFPGCALADDILCGEDEAFKRVVEERNKLKAELREIRKPQLLEVWRPKSGGEKFVIIGPKVRQRVIDEIEDFEFVCNLPHADGDYSYLCRFENCRCSE